MNLRYVAPVSLGALLVVLILLVFTLPTKLTTTAVAFAPSTLVQNVRLVDDQGEYGSPVSILIENGLIQSVGTLAESSAATVIDGTGMIALPGLIDSHTHSYGSALQDAAGYGVTTLLDMFTDPSMLRDTVAARDNLAPTNKADLFSAGMLATAPGGHGTQFGVRVETLTAAEQASVWVQARKAEGSDYIKLVYMPNSPDWPSIDRRIAKAVIAAGHEQGLMVVAHISTREAAAAMIADGIDGLVHVVADKLIDAALLQEAKAKQVFVVPTLAVMESIGGQAQGFSFDIALKNTAALHRAGVPILAGSDAPNPGTAHGLTLHHELQLLVRAGFTPREALAAATIVPARVFGLEGRGSIEPGHRADILLVTGGPLQDIGTTLNIHTILKNGGLIEH